MFNWKKLGAVVAVLVPLGGIVWGFLDYTNSRWTFYFEHKALAADLQQLDLQVQEQRLDSITQQWYQNLREQRNYTDTGQPVPDKLIKEQSFLENRKRKIERHIMQLEREEDQ